MIKILVHIPQADVELSPFEVLVPEIPRRGDSFRTGDRELFNVSHVCFEHVGGQSCSVHVFLGLLKATE